MHSHGGRYAATTGIDLAKDGGEAGGTALAKLRQVWANDGQAAESFADFEAALVRAGLRLRRAELRHSKIP